MTDMTIRAARPTDTPRLRQLAALDSRTVPRGELRVGVLDGEIQAAMSVDGRRVIANPFVRTAELVEVLAAADPRARPRSTPGYRRRHGALRLA